MQEIIVVEAQPIYRIGLVGFIKRFEHWEIICACDSAESACRVMDAQPPSIVVAGIWNDAMAVPAKRHRVVLVSNASPPAYPFHAILGRDVDEQGLLDCLQGVHGGRILTPTPIPESDPVGVRVRDALTQKEKKIAAGIVRGLKNKDIAKEIGHSEQVIKNYLRSVYDKSGMSTRLEFAMFVTNHPALANAIMGA